MCVIITVLAFIVIELTVEELLYQPLGSPAVRPRIQSDDSVVTSSPASELAYRLGRIEGSIKASLCLAQRQRQATQPVLPSAPTKPQPCPTVPKPERKSKKERRRLRITGASAVRAEQLLASHNNFGSQQDEETVRVTR